MEKNVFTFNEEYWLQILGTCMGTRVAPTYANLFMGILEQKILDNCPPHLRQHILLWKRYIDDILIVWTDSWDSFLEFFDYINNYHQTMKYDEPCYESSTNSCNFPDLNISVHNGKLITDLYRKPTDKPRALLPSSAHPTHITGNIIYSMAFRLIRICSGEESFKKRLSELKEDFLIPRGYKASIIDGQFKRILELPGDSYFDKRKEALKKKERNQGDNKRIISPFQYNPLLPKASTVLSKHYNTMIFNNPDLKEVFPEAPMAALRQGSNLRKHLCRSQLYKTSRDTKFQRNTRKTANGWKKCSKPCPVCPLTAPPKQIVHSEVSNYIHTIKTPVNCQSENVVYMWRCRKENCIDKPENFYIGMTKRKFQIRFSEHLGYIKSDKLSEPSGEHFNLPGHQLSDIEGMVLEKVRSNNPYILRAREELLIQKFDSYQLGLNKER